MMSQQKSIAEDLKRLMNSEKIIKLRHKPSQKKAADKMKSMSKKMSQSLEGSVKTDGRRCKMLRQILDNLLAYSLSQEYVMVQFRGLKTGFRRSIKTLNYNKI
jgi:hypothetical protein